MHPAFLAVRGQVTVSIYLRRPAGVSELLVKYRLSSTSSTAADNTDQLHTILKHTHHTPYCRRSTLQPHRYQNVLQNGDGFGVNIID
jgi:hypothetical protein